MKNSSLYCTKCGKDNGYGMSYSCAYCGNILAVKPDITQIESFMGGLKSIKDDSCRGIWKYGVMLPVKNHLDRISLDEGATPLHYANRLGEIIGISRFLLKDETRQPTGSFKDRPTAVAVSKAKEFKAGRVVTASSGNAGASAAAYAAYAGLQCLTFVPENAPVGKLTQIRMYGATIIPVKGNYSNSYKLAKYAAAKYGYCNITTTHLNPYSVEGDKTVSYELAEQLSLEVPDWIIVPIGAGPLLTGIYRGFLELKEYGIIERIPKMVGAQAEGCAPVAKAFNEGASKISPWIGVNTVASGVSDPLTGYEQDGDYTLECIIRSGGIAMSVSDELIMQMADLIASKEGIYCESTAAVSVAVAHRMASEGIIAKNSSVVCLITGSGLKDTALYSGKTSLPKALEPDENALDDFINRIG